VGNMRRIGIVASGSTVMEAGVILAEGEERNVKAEDLVLVHLKNRNTYFYGHLLFSASITMIIPARMASFRLA